MSGLDHQTGSVQHLTDEYRPYCLHEAITRNITTCKNLFNITKCLNLKICSIYRHLFLRRNIWWLYLFSLQIRSFLPGKTNTTGKIRTALLIANQGCLCVRVATFCCDLSKDHRIFLNQLLNVTKTQNNHKSFEPQ